MAGTNDAPVLNSCHESQVLVEGEAPESDEDDMGEDAAEQLDQNVMQRSVNCKNRYPDLLHKRLRDKNQMLHRNMRDIIRMPYVNAITSIKSLKDRMHVPVKTIENVSSNLRKLSSDVKCLTVCMRHLSEVAAVFPIEKSLKSD